MSQSAVNAAPRSANTSSGSNDTTADPVSSASSRSLRSHTQGVNEGDFRPAHSTVKENSRSREHNSRAQQLQRLQTTIVDGRSQAVVDPTPARMTRQWTVTSALSSPEKPTVQRDGESPPQSAASPGTVPHICLCQPDPKIPRPRNAFILYRQNNQQNIIHQNKGLSNPEISKIAGELWRNEPEEVKRVWKDLANAEKVRHAQQYPDYRFQPRHKNKISPISGPSERVRCSKCGGQSIAANSSPFPTPVEAKVAKVRLATPPETSEETDASSQQEAAMLNTFEQPHQGERYVSAGSSLTRKYPESTMESSDPKRRRFDAYSGSVSATTRPEFGRAVITHGQTPTSAHAQPYPSPRFADSRRGSLSAHPDGAYYMPRGSIGRSPDSPSTLMPHSAVPVMGPPPSRLSSISGRNALHAYPATPLALQQHHGLPFPTPHAPSRPRTDSESLRLAPLLSPSAGDQSRSIGAMIMTIPVVGKLGQLRRIAPPIKAPASDSPAFQVRGSIIAVEGDDREASDTMLTQLETYLRRNDEFDVRVLAGPRDPGPQCTFKDFLDMVCKWHEETRKMIDFVTGVEYQRIEERLAGVRINVEKDISSRKTSVSGDPMDTDLEEGEGELREADQKPPKHGQSPAEEVATELEKKKVEMAAAVEREARRVSAASDNNHTKIPLLVVSSYILSASNSWSSALPINDVYSPADHWAWTATLWRGITGADLTVYVRNVDADAGVDPTSAGTTVTQEKKVDMREEVGAILVKREAGRVEDGAVRRVAFEVGEWVRMQAGKLS